MSTTLAIPVIAALGRLEPTLREPPSVVANSTSSIIAEPELRHRIEDERDPHRRDVALAAPIPSSPDPEEEADHRHQTGRRADQEQRRPQESSEDRWSPARRR